MKLNLTINTLKIIGLSYLRKKIRIKYPVVIKNHVKLYITGSFSSGKNFKVERFSSIVAYHNAKLTMGDNVFVGSFSLIVANREIEIGNDVMIADFVVIRDHNHRFDKIGVPINRQGMINKPIKIGNNVWIGTKATILSGVTIGDNCIIGANAVVTKDIPSNSVAVGIPAKVVKTIDADSQVSL